MVHAKYPHKWIVYDSPGMGFNGFLFALDTKAETSHSHDKKHRLASHIWDEVGGMIVKDEGGIFNATTINTIKVFPSNPYRYTSYYHNPTGKTYFVDTTNVGNIIFDSVIDDTVFSINPKCECGASSVGSSSHSNWCEIKGNI